jgi:hypothetical protein
MKFFSASVCFFALFCNLTVASFGGMIYCIEKASGELCSVSASELFLSSDKCCPVDPSQNQSTGTFPFDCDHCTDIETAEGDRELGPMVERIGLKTPAAQEWISVDLIPVRGATSLLRKISTKAPPIPCGASRQYADTIQFRV